MNFSTAIPHLNGPLRAQRHQNHMAGMWETAKFSPIRNIRKQKRTLLFSLKDI